jgi:hypothetical protein
MKQQRMVSNAEDLCAEAGVDTLDELGALLTDLKFEIIVRPDVGTGADLELYAPAKGRGQGEYWPLSWPELQQSILDFETLIEEEAEEIRQSIEEPDKPPVILPTLTGSQRLHLIQGRKYALGDYMADARDAQCWFAPERYTRGDLLLSVLKTQPPVLLCIERARTKPKGPSINVGTRGLYFHRLVPVHVIEQRAGVTLPQAPATLRKKVAAAVLDAIATELSNPTAWLDSAVGGRSGAGCRIPTGVQAAALMAAPSVCQACGRDYGALLDGRGIAGLEVHDLGGLARSSDNTNGDDTDPQSDRRAELSAKTLKALRKLAMAAGFAAEEVSTADRDEIIESLICDELAAEDNGNNDIPPEEDDEYGPFTGAEGHTQIEQKNWNRPQAMYTPVHRAGSVGDDEADEDEGVMLDAVMGRDDEMNRFAVLCGGCHLLTHSVGSPSVETVKLAWRPACPRCGAHPPNAILWGLPAGPVDDPYVTYGGCDVDGDPAKWHCTGCGLQWGR